MTERTETVAPLLVAGALGELSAENLAVEIVDMPGPDAYAAMARGEVDIVVGGVDGPFARRGPRRARRPPRARRAGGATPATSAPRRQAFGSAGVSSTRTVTGTTSRGRRSSSRAGSPRPPSSRSTPSWPNIRSASPTSTSSRPPSQAVDTLHAAAVGGTWRWPSIEAAADEELMLATTTPGSESIDGTVFAPRLLGADRAVRLASRALIRTINTHPAKRVRGALPAVAEALTVDEDVVAEGPRCSTGRSGRGRPPGCRTPCALGGVGFERPIAEDGLVDRAIAAASSPPPPIRADRPGERRLDQRAAAAQVQA